MSLGNALRRIGEHQSDDVGSLAVTAVVPVFRGERTLREALHSLLTQNVEGLEVLVLDDGSPDESVRIATDMASRASGCDIAVLQHPNRGLAATLNRGIRLAKGRYIARQDQDDVVLPGRLSKQIEFLDANPEIAMVGTWARIYADSAPTDRYHIHPVSNEALQLELLFDNPFVHSSMMIRADVLRELGGYCEDRTRQPPEDYELWSRIARCYRVANLPDILTIYREMPGSMSRDGRAPFLKNVTLIASENLAHVLAPTYSEDDCMALAQLHHAGAGVGGRCLLSRHKIREMLLLAATRIGGDPTTWTKEFQSSYRRIRLHLDYQLIRRFMPESLQAAARWLRNKMRRSS